MARLETLTVKNETQETIEATPELINAVDEVFNEQIAHLDNLAIDPELERGMGMWVKNCTPSDSTAGTESEA